MPDQLKPAVAVLAPPDVDPATGAGDVVTAAELSAHLKLNTGSAELADLAGFVASARLLFERHTGRVLLPTGFRQWLPRLAGRVELLRADVTEVTAVKYYDPSEILTDLVGWQLDASGTPAVVYVPGCSYPAVSATRPRPAYVEFTAGYASPAAVPAVIRTAVKLMAGHWYRFREAFTEVPLRELPVGFQTVVSLWDTALTRGG